MQIDKTSPFLRYMQKKFPAVIARPRLRKICPEMHANEIHELNDRHHKVSPNLNSH